MNEKSGVTNEGDNDQKAGHVNCQSATVGSVHKWQLTCKKCGAVEVWEAASYEKASDKIVTMGWSSDRFMGGMVCPQCRVA